MATIEIDTDTLAAIERWWGFQPTNSSSVPDIVGALPIERNAARQAVASLVQAYRNWAHEHADDELVEAMAKAMWESDPQSSSWPGNNNVYLREARAALAVAKKALS